MPLVFKALKTSSNQVAPWRSLEFNAAARFVVWHDSPHRIAGQECTSKRIYTYEDQVKVITGNYSAFKYVDDALIDDGLSIVSNIKRVSSFLNERGDKADFTEATFERGWLSPSGEFIGCAEGHHLGLMTYTLGKSLEEAKNDGWIMIQPDVYLKRSSIPETPAQLNVLEQLGFDGLMRTDIPRYNNHFEEAREKQAKISDVTQSPVLLKPPEARQILNSMKSVFHDRCEENIQQLLKSSALIQRHQSSGARAMRHAIDYMIAQQLFEQRKMATAFHKSSNAQQQPVAKIEPGISSGIQTPALV